MTRCNWTKSKSSQVAKSLLDGQGVISNAAARIGYPNVRPKQEAVSYFIDGKDVFVSLPTGSGKSLCYCILPGVFDEDKRSSSS